VQLKTDEGMVVGETWWCLHRLTRAGLIVSLCDGVGQGQDVGQLPFV